MSPSRRVRRADAGSSSRSSGIVHGPRPSLPSATTHPVHQGVAPGTWELTSQLVSRSSTRVCRLVPVHRVDACRCNYCGAAGDVAASRTAISTSGHVRGVARGRRQRGSDPRRHGHPQASGRNPRSAPALTIRRSAHRGFLSAAAGTNEALSHGLRGERTTLGAALSRLRGGALLGRTCCGMGCQPGAGAPGTPIVAPARGWVKVTARAFAGTGRRCRVRRVRRFVCLSPRCSARRSSCSRPATRPSSGPGRLRGVGRGPGSRRVRRPHCSPRRCRPRARSGHRDSSPRRDGNRRMCHLDRVLTNRWKFAPWRSLRSLLCAHFALRGDLRRVALKS